MDFEKNKKSLILVFLIFLITLSIRLYFAFSSNNFDYDAYFAIRQINHIKETGFPLFKDNLSFSGNLVIFSPVFYYIISLFSLFLKTEIAAKILQNLFITLIIPITYLISKKITKNNLTSIISALFVSFIPSLSKEAFSIDSFSLALPLILISIYYLIDINERNVVHFLISTIFSAIINPISVVLIPLFWIYLLFLRIDKVKRMKVASDSIIFSTFFILLIQFLIYKKAFLMHGYSIIWQNIPNELFSKYFSELNLLSIVEGIGFIPFVFGIYETYKLSWNEERSKVGIIALF